MAVVATSMIQIYDAYAYTCTHAICAYIYIFTRYKDFGLSLCVVCLELADAINILFHLEALSMVVTG